MPEDPRPLVVGVGAAAAPGADLLLPLGPAHPTSHGGLQLRLTLDGTGPDSVVLSADPAVGLLHRGAEKLFEHRDYRQALMLADRHDWHSAFSGELVLALAVESALGIAVPERAVWLRTALAELTRPMPALLFLGAFPEPDPATVASRLHAATALRDRLADVLEALTGGRLHPMYTRIGGVVEDLPEGWTAQAREALDVVAGGLPGVTEAALRAAEPLRGLAAVRRSDVGDLGLSGPVARASGATLDLRRDEPYLGYGALDVPLVGRSAGDVPARLECLAEGAGVALRLAVEALDRLESTHGPVNVRLPKVVRLPEGETYAWVEAALGISGAYVVSRGEPRPWRLRLRTTSFATAQVLPRVLPGVRLRDVPGVLASFFLVVGDIDK